MSNNGLFTFLKSGGFNSAIRKGYIAEFKGKRAGIHGNAWIHKSISHVAKDVFFGKASRKYVEYCIDQIRLLLTHEIIPVLVFDGSIMPLNIVQQRELEQKEFNRKKALELIERGKSSEANEFMRRSVKVTREMINEVMKAARALQIDCIYAPYKADAQLAYMQKQNYIDLIIADDSNLILFGCKTIFFKMNKAGAGEVYEKHKLPAAVSRPDNMFVDFSFEKFKYAVMMAGCDYLKNLPGVGITKALRLVNTCETTEIRLILKGVPSYFKLKNFVSNEYINHFIMANMCYLYQYVFDPIKLERVNFNQVDEYSDEYKNFINAFEIVEVNHVQLALGNIDYDSNVYGNYSLKNVPIHSIFHRVFVYTKFGDVQNIPKPVLVGSKTSSGNPLQELNVHVMDPKTFRTENLVSTSNNENKENETKIATEVENVVCVPDIYLDIFPETMEQDSE